MVNPAGKVSVKPTPVNGIVFSVGLDTVKVRTEICPAAIVTGEKALLSAGGATTRNVSQASS